MQGQHENSARVGVSVLVKNGDRILLESASTVMARVRGGHPAATSNMARHLRRPPPAKQWKKPA